MANLLQLGALCGVVMLIGIVSCRADDAGVDRHDAGGAAGEGGSDSAPQGQGGDGTAVTGSLGGEHSGGQHSGPGAEAGAPGSGDEGGAGNIDAGGGGGSGPVGERVPGRGAVQLVVGDSAICVLLDSGAVRCWGVSSSGQLGHADQKQIGDDEIPFDAADVDVGGKVTQLVAGNSHVCALLENGAVRCWGDAPSIGYGNANDIGDDETPASAGDVDVGGKVIQLAASFRHTCALLVGGTVRCWGWHGWGELGYGNKEDIGDDETPASAGDVDVGGTVTQIATGPDTTCALLESGSVRCWGNGGRGGLGYGNQFDIGDDETPASAGDVSIGGTVVEVAAGAGFACVRLSTGSVRCWGDNYEGELGYGNTERIGDDETPIGVDDIELGGEVTNLATGTRHSCVVLAGGGVRCWGAANRGCLGYGNNDHVGDDETPASVGEVDVGGPVQQVAVAAERTCALLTNGAVRCWGDGVISILGYLNYEMIGDDETPASAGDVLY